jgi:putative tryptophan/tyrosine transport system substrate-binding protein
VRRRQFIAALGGASVAWPLAARAQQPAMPVIGFLHQGASEPNQGFVAKFRQGLRENGYLDGSNVTIDFRWADGNYEKLPALAADLARRGVTMIFAAYRPAALAAKSATSSLPIVFASGSDPVEAGLVASLNRPGGNVTGVNLFGGILGSKRLELLRELDLSLPEIKSGRIDGAIRPGSAGRECAQRPEHRAKPAHPCSAISACEPRCNIFDTI